ncbi:MAG: type II toxin-antitoxin system Phd/YefM family antitoxin [Chlamydiales bacterium]|nr:type II toxin-antitoxin system Phd/YefM family antitoxin [Chlamydiales bacterium]
MPNLGIWQTQEAKARFSNLIKDALDKGDQFISFRGEPVAVVISMERYDELTKPANSLLDFFRNAPLQEVELEIKRSKELPRDISL